MHESVFSSSEQAYFYHKAIICEREDIAMKIKEMENPAMIKQKGDRIDTCEEWEKSKKSVMQKVLAQKFIQNPELKAKLMGTSGLPLLECTNNKYWGTGWFLDDQEWNSSVNYPGKNVLGSLLEELRDSFDLDVLNSTEVVNSLPEPMVTETVPIETTILPGCPETQLSDGKVITSRKETPVLAKGNVVFASARKPSGLRSTAKDLAKSIKPVVLEELRGENIPINTASEKAMTSTEDNGTLVEDITEADNFDSVSFTSSIFSDGSDSFDAKNVTLPNGRLDIDKLMSWSLPPVNLSRVLERSSCRSPGTRGKIQRLMDAQKGSKHPDHSTPAATITTCRKKTKKSVKSYFEDSGTVSEKESIKKMLQNN